MRPSHPGPVVGLAVVAGVLALAAVRLLDVTVPAVPWTLPLVLGIVSLGMLAATLSFRRRLRGEPGAKPYDPLHAARMVVLAKACIHAGALLAGVYAGLAGGLLLRSTSSARHADALVAGLAALAAVSLVAVGFFLEHVCRVPPGSDEPGAQLDADRSV